MMTIAYIPQRQALSVELRPEQPELRKVIDLAVEQTIKRASIRLNGQWYEFLLRPERKRKARAR